MAKKKKTDAEEPKAENTTPEIEESKPEKPSRLHGKKPVRSPGPPEKAQVPLKVFVRAFGKKWDQVAGFMHYAETEKLGPMCMEDWRKEFKKFMDSPA